MKKVLLLITVCAFTNLLNAQAPQKAAKKLTDEALSEIIANKSFTKKDQVDIQKILGKDFKALLDTKGHLIVVTPKSVNQIKSTPAGEFVPFDMAKTTPQLIFWWGKGHGHMRKKYLQAKMAAALGEERNKQLIALITR